MKLEQINENATMIEKYKNDYVSDDENDPDSICK